MGGYISTKEENKKEEDWDKFLKKSRQTREIVYEHEVDNQLEKFDQKKDSKSKTIKEKKIHKVNLNTYIEENLTSEPHKSKVDTFTIKAQLKSKLEKEFIINIYFQCVENIDKEGIFLGMNYKKKLTPLKFKKKEEELIFEMDLKNVPLDNLRDIKNNLYHLCIEVVEKNLISIYIYTLNVKKMFKPLLIRKGVVIDKKYISLKSIFGIVNIKGGENSEKCIICFDNNIDTVMKPCNHMCLCKECSASFKEHSALCPICRQKFESFEAFVLK